MNKIFKFVNFHIFIRGHLYLKKYQIEENLGQSLPEVVRRVKLHSPRNLYCFD